VCNDTGKISTKGRKQLSISHVVFAHKTHFTAALSVLVVRATARRAESREMLYYMAKVGRTRQHAVFIPPTFPTVGCTRQHAVFIPPTLSTYRGIETPCSRGGQIWPHLVSLSKHPPLLFSAPLHLPANLYPFVPNPLFCPP
jgi:hypothetical protein